jgi:hypothetical protein
VLTAVAAPKETQQAVSPSEAGGFHAMKAAAPLPAAATSPVYLAFPFRCVIRNGGIVLEPTSEPYYHEALDYRPAAPFDICPADTGISACKRFELTGLRLVCQGGIASAPALTLARPAQHIRMVRLKGDALVLPFYTGPRAPEEPDNLYQAPAGLGLLPKPTDLISADDFASMYDPVRARVALPRSFFLALANWFPVPQLVCFPLLLAAIVLAFCGFSVINPQSQLSPKRAWYWVLSVAAVLGLFYALMVGRDIHDAYGIGRPAIASPFIKHDGHIEPFSTHDAEAARHPRQPQTDAEAKALAGDVATKAYLALLPVLLFLGVYARYIFAGYHYFFARHPIEAAAGHELRTGDLFDLQKVGDALKTNPEHLFNPPPLHETMNKMQRAKAFREQTEADAELSEVMIRRDRLRAQQHQVEAELRTIRKRLPWWHRWW